MSGRNVASFIPGAAGPLFVLARRPDRASGRCVLIVPPFADEMNKCRRMFTDLASALSERGTASVIADLYGTGDSGGEFRDATWEQWQKDLRDIADWSAAAGWPVTHVLAVRLGCLLAIESMGSLPFQCRGTVFWQPVADGKRFVAQFLRLRLAASLLGTEGKETLKDLRNRLQTQRVLEVAGYELSHDLVAGIERAAMPAELDARLGVVHWLEVVRDSAAPAQGLAAPAAANRARVVGEPFWASTEIVTNPSLIERTLDAFASAA